MSSIAWYATSGETVAPVEMIRSIHIRHLYLSHGHNYFGRHGMASDTNELSEVDEVECVAGRGLRGDRFFDYQENYKGQITFFSIEVLDAVCLELNVNNCQRGATRRNVLTEGVDLNSLIGQRFSIQGIRFEGVSECKPCYWMDEAIGPGAENALKGRGGLRARILSNGILRKGG